MSPERFREILPTICDQETSQDSAGWTSENPLWGHCAAVALVAQDLFGGELMRASLENTKFVHMRSHYWNRLQDGTEIDFSNSQFGTQYPQGLQGEVRTRDYVLFDPATGQPREIMERYNLLKQRLRKFINS